jgi:hypothetical protein
MTPHKFEKIFAVEERDSEGFIIGDRLRLVVGEDFGAAGVPYDPTHVSVHREHKMQAPTSEDMSWDWQPLSDGLSMSREHAIELRDALNEALEAMEKK